MAVKQLIKEQRQARILEVLKDNEIKTQEDLAKKLIEEGFQVTQSTVSRDLRDLGLSKATFKGLGKYYIPEPVTRESSQPFDYEALGDASYRSRIKNVFRESVVKIEKAYFLIVVHTLPGMAAAAAHTIDVLKLEKIAGTIAGDDTIFIAVKDKNDVDELLELFNDLMN